MLGYCSYFLGLGVGFLISSNLFSYADFTNPGNLCSSSAADGLSAAFFSSITSMSYCSLGE